MPTLEIITIGTELLLGEITDTNSTYLARTLRDHGIDIYRIITIGDNPARISSTIKESLKRADIIITTGGLGPTVDDPTRQAVANATDRDLVFKPELWEDIVERFKNYDRKPTENNRRQAYIPAGAIPIENPVGTAPCYIVEVDGSFVISLPGVPKEMEFILKESVIPFLRKKFVLESQIIKATVLHTASMGESVIDEIIDDLERGANPTVGLLAHPGQIDIRVTAKATSEHEARDLIKPVVEDLKSRLGENIYGQDGETLESIVCQSLNKHHFSLCLMTYGFDGTLISRVNKGLPDQIQTNFIENQPEGLSDLQRQLNRMRQEHDCDISLGVALLLNEKNTLHLIYQDGQVTKTLTRKYGGPPSHGPLWAQNIGLDFLRRELNTTLSNQKMENYETS